jgi:hypothetical protein
LATITPPVQAKTQLSAAFASAGEAFAIATDKSVMMYDTDPGKLAGTLCSYVGGPITEAQWQQYAPGIPPQNPCPRPPA